MANKFGRRYRRHQEKHQAYFDDLARQVMRQRRMTVEFGGKSFEVRLRRWGRWLDISEPGGSTFSEERLPDPKDQRLDVISDALMRLAASCPGVTIPSPDVGLDAGART